MADSEGELSEGGRQTRFTQFAAPNDNELCQFFVNRVAAAADWRRLALTLPDALSISQASAGREPA